MGKYDKITEYIDKFENPGRYLQGDGSFKDQLYGDYGMLPSQFITVFDEFADHQYGDTLERNHLEWGWESMTGFDPSDADEECILALITAAIRADHFSNGMIIDFIKGGYITNWLKRLREIDSGH